MENKKTNRITAPDLLRGLGILLMVEGHIHTTPDALRSFIYAFHMPLFFLISGYFYRKPASAGSFMKRKAKAFFTPYLVFGLYYAITEALKADLFSQSFLGYLNALFVNPLYHLPAESALWFLPSLFFTELFALLIDQTNRKKLIWILTVVLTLVGCFWSSIFSFRLPWAMDTALAAQGFFRLGQLYREKSAVIEAPEKVWNRPYVGFFTAFITAILIHLNGSLNMRTGSWGFIPLTYFNAVAFTWCCYRFCLLLEKKFSSAASILLVIGQRSMVFLCMNHSIIRLCRNAVDLCFPNCENLFCAFASEFMLFLFSVILLYTAAALFEKTNLRILLGKPPLHAERIK